MRKLATIILTLAFGLAPLACDSNGKKTDAKSADKKADEKTEKTEEKKDGGGGW